MFFGNVFIYYMMLYVIENMKLLHKYPLYIHFFNCRLNVVPDFLSKKREIGIVIQKQFEELDVNNRYIYVVLYFDGKACPLQIDMLTIYSIEIVGKGKIDLDHRHSPEYFSSIQNIIEHEYIEKVKEIIGSVYNKDKFYSLGRLPDKTQIEEDDNKVIDMDNLIKGDKKNE